MSDFKPGDRVDITIKGARVRLVREHLSMLGENVADQLSYETDGGFVASVVLTEDVTVERVAPAEWPPRPGDLWRDKDGAIWFAVAHPHHSGPHLRGHDDGIAPADFIAENYGPLTLVRREDEQDGDQS
jgi:hypothetical protein